MRPPRRKYRSGRGPRGTVIVLLTVMLVVLLGLAALTVDIGVVATIRAQLQTAADAAALAGARQLATERRMSKTITDLTAETTAARTQAIAIAQANYVSGKALSASNITVTTGYVDESAANPGSTFSATAASTTHNSVQVSVTYQSAAIFGGVLRSGGTTVSATSTATVGLAQIASFNSNLGLNAQILPIVLDQTTYNAMIAGTTSDQYSFNSATYVAGTTSGVTSGADGVAESKFFPVSTGSPGNWGTVSFDGKGGGGAAALKQEISGSGSTASGMTPAQMIADLPLPAWFYAKSGMNASISGDLTSIMGKAAVVPVYDTTNGSNGANLQYRVVSYAGVRIVAVNFQGSNKYVIAQPAIITDPTAVPATGNLSTSWSNGGVVVVHLTR
ncbi:MAG: hypothetical protein JWN86_1572 [Planctomycetota bacterium]|nr:hypothetical protein [Planctomycetota bacterium]